MSDFSVICRDAIKDAGLTIYQIAKNSGLDRTTMQKMITGSKLPSYAFFYKFMDQLRLNEEEKKKLLEVFQIEKDGFAAFHNREKIREMIQNLGKRVEVSEAVYENRSHGGYAENEDALLKMIYQAMKESLRGKEPIVFRMNLPRSLYKVYGILQILKDEISGGGVPISVEQIIMLNKNPMYSPDSNVNLDYLSGVLNMASCFEEAYRVYYQYVRGNERDYDMLFWPYYILLPGRVLFLSADGQSGYMEERQEVWQRSKTVFDSLCRNAKPFLNEYSDYFRALSTDLNYEIQYETPSYTLENENFMNRIYEEKITVKEWKNSIVTYLNPDFPFRMEVAGSLRVTFFFWTQKGKMKYVEIKEPSVCEAFLDFMLYLGELQRMSSLEELEK